MKGFKSEAVQKRNLDENIGAFNDVNKVIHGSAAAEGKISVVDAILVKDRPDIVISHFCHGHVVK